MERATGHKYICRRASSAAAPKDIIHTLTYIYLATTEITYEVMYEVTLNSTLVHCRYCPYVLYTPGWDLFGHLCQGILNMAVPGQEDVIVAATA